MNGHTEEQKIQNPSSSAYINSRLINQLQKINYVSRVQFPHKEAWFLVMTYNKENTTFHYSHLSRREN